MQVPPEIASTYPGEVLEGRDEELRRVRDAISLRRPVVVSGVAGIGKSTLVSAIVAEHPGARVGQSLPALTHRAHHPLLHAFGWTNVPGGTPSVSAAVRAASDQGDLVVLEDLQWADAGTLEVIAELAGERAMLCTVQEGSPNADAVLHLIEAVGGVMVELGPLEASVVAAAVRATKPDLLQGEVRRVVDAAAGNPLVAEVLAASTDGATSGRPGGHSKVLMAALARQSPAARATLFALGAAPGPLPVALLAEVDGLERAGLVRRTGDERCELVNQIFGSPELLRVGESERREVFARLASLADLSTHQRSEYLLAAGQPSAAMEAALLAAGGPTSRADQASALLTAAQAAVELHAAGLLPDDELHPLVVGAARALNDSTRFADAHQLLVPAVLEGPLELEAVVEWLRAAIGTGDRRLAVKVVRAHAAVIDEAEGSDGARARGLRNMVVPAVSSGVDLLRLAQEQRGSATSSTQRAQAAVMAGLSSYPVDIDESMAWFRVAREEAAASGALASELDATRNLVSVQIALGRHEEARQLARAAEARAAEAGERSWSIEFRTLEMLSRFYDDGDHDETLSWLSYVRTAPVRLETRAMATGVLATLLADRGAVRRSAEVLEPWMAQDRLECLEPFSQAFLAWGAAQRSWIIGDLAATIRIARWVTETVPPGYPSLAGTQVVWRWAEYESGVAITAPDPVGGLLDCSTIEAGAIDLLADGRPADAAEVFLAAAESWRPILWRCTLRCRWAAGHALSLAGDRRAARSLLESVDAELDRSGVPALRTRVVASLRSTDRSPTTTSPGPRGSSLLTSQERKVMLLVVEGLTSNEIARRLGIAPSTVNTHVRSAKHKLGARTRIEAAAMVGLQVD
jgi:DNA-binding CsgD family transcriptional regulator